MDNIKFADFLFPDVTVTPDELELRYPPRNLPEGAKVTRIAPSPTGFMHLGNLFSAITDERLAHQSEGIFYLRIEDTDRKREVEGGVQTIISAFNTFGLNFDEGATVDGDNGAYGPYRQSLRADIYKVYVKKLISEGRAYPCFCTEDDLAEMRKTQEENKENFGYYGKYAKYRDLSIEDAKAKIDAGTPYVVRFKSMGSIENKVKHTDLVKGNMELTQNDQDIVIFKSDGLPTYHFAHAVDDHLMRTTHVVRGEEWLATLPVHIELFDTLGFKRPKYVHTAQLMKMENGNKRKLSKRLDPELALDFYYGEGYPVPAVIEYLMTLLNSNFEEWRIANPDSDIKNFPFSPKKMSVSGSLFDIDKLRDVSRNLISRMTAEEVYSHIANWLCDNDKEFYDIFTADKEKSCSILAIGRGGKKPRKDIALWSDVKPYMDFFFDSLFTPDYTSMPENVSKEDCIAILTDYLEIYNIADNNEDWFNKMKDLAVKHGFAGETKLYKKNPNDYKGHVGDISMVIRVAMAGRTNCPELYDCMQILGEEIVKTRLNRAINEIK